MSNYYDQIRISGRGGYSCIALLVFLTIGYASNPTSTSGVQRADSDSGCSLFANASGTDVQDEPARVEIPFELTQWNNMSVSAMINGKEQVHLMFHLANNSVDIIAESARKMKSVHFNQTGNANSWGGSSETRYSEGNSLSIGEFNWDDVTIHEDMHSGRSTDGKFGPFLFGDKKIQIDFEREVITIRDDLPDDIEDYTKLKYELRRGSMFVSATLSIPNQDGQNQAIDQEFMVHSGYSGSLLLDDEFVHEYQILEKLTTLSESELKDSLGNVIKTKKVELPAFEVAGGQFDDLPAGLFEGGVGRQKNSVLGMDVLKRFHIVIDRKNNEIYMRPNQLFDSAYYK